MRYQTRQLTKLGNVPIETEWIPPDTSGNGGGVILIHPPIFIESPIEPNSPIFRLPVTPRTPTTEMTIISTSPPNQNPMANTDTLPECNCLTGRAYRDSSGNCQCENDTPTKSNDVKIVTAGQVLPILNNTQAQPVNIAEKIKANPMLALAGAGLLAYLILKK
jgi:hypothetical protein